MNADGGADAEAEEDVGTAPGPDGDARLPG